MGNWEMERVDRGEADDDADRVDQSKIYRCYHLVVHTADR